MFEFYKGKLVAVTGGTGLNGSYIVKALVEAGAKVRAITHKRPTNRMISLATYLPTNTNRRWNPMARWIPSH